MCARVLAGQLLYLGRHNCGVIHGKEKVCQIDLVRVLQQAVVEALILDSAAGRIFRII